MNPAPDADLHSVGKDNFEWIVDRVAKLAVKKALNPVGVELRWAGFLGGEVKAPAVRSAPKKAVAKKSVVKKSASKKAMVKEMEMGIPQSEPLK
jgi:hypothetical protein